MNTIPFLANGTVQIPIRNPSVKEAIRVTPNFLSLVRRGTTLAVLGLLGLGLGNTLGEDLGVLGLGELSVRVCEQFDGEWLDVRPRP